MNKFMYFAKLLAYSISDPKKGKDLLNSKLHSMKDSSASIFDYSTKQSNLEQILNAIFTDLPISISEAQKNTQNLQNHINSFFNELGPKKYPSKKKPYPTEYSIDDKSGLFLYLLCKIMKPKIILETGVAYGLSSMYILQALKENNNGTLYSIDSIFSPWQSKEMIGSGIPFNLRDRWKFIFGSSSEKLQDTLSKLNQIDIFIHDSLHTYKNMMFEFETTWKYISKNGFLISDDIGNNNAFYNFTKKFNLTSFILPQKEKSFLGIINKL